MVSLLLLALAVGASTPEPLLSTVSYSVAKVTEASGGEFASLLAVSTTAIDPDVLTTAQAFEWTNLATRIGMEYDSDDSQKRANLIRQVLKLQQPGSSRTDHSVWLRFPDATIVRAERVGYPPSGVIWRLCDLSTGQYMAVVRSGGGPDLSKLFEELFRHESDNTIARIREETAKAEQHIEAMVEVNGQRRYLAKGTATPGAVTAELVALFPNFFVDGRERLLKSLALLEAVRAGTVEASDPTLNSAMVLCAAPVVADGLPLPAIPETLRVTVTGGRQMPTLSAPAESVVEPFFGRKGWKEPDLTRSFKMQVTKLLSSSN